MEIKAQLRFLRLAPRKVRAILDIVRGLSVKEAEAQLLLIKKRAAQPILKLLNSALANAKNNYSLHKDDLQIKKIEAQEGPTLHRWFPRAFGRAAPIRKRSSHLLIVLEPKKGITLPQKAETKILPKEEIKEEIQRKVEEEKAPESQKEKKAKEIKKESRVKEKSSFIKKVFRRKTI